MAVGDYRKRQQRLIRILAALIIALIVINALVAFLMSRFPVLADLSGYVQAGIQLASIVFAVMTLQRELSETQRLELSCALAGKDGEYASIVDGMEAQHHMLEEIWSLYSERNAA